MTTNGTPNNIPDDVLALAKKLTNMTTAKGCTEAEAAAAMVRVQKLLADYNLSQVDIENYRLKDVSINPVVQHSDLFGTNYREKCGEWKRTLAYAVARYNFCEGLTSRFGFTFVGRKTDVEVATELFNWLLEQCDHITEEATTEYTKNVHELYRMRRYTIDQGKPLTAHQQQRLNFFKEYFGNYFNYPSHGMKWRSGFVAGLIDRLEDLLRARWNEMRTGSKEGMALVVITDNAILDYKKEHMPYLFKKNLKGFTEKGPSSYSGFEHGRKAADKISLTPTRKLDSDNVRRLN